MDKTIEMNGKTYHVTTMDVGQGPTDYVFVETRTGPSAVTYAYAREVPRGGPTWKKVMKEAQNHG